MRNHEVPEGWYSRLIKHAVREAYYDYQDLGDWRKRQADFLNELLDDWEMLGEGKGFRIHYMLGSPSAEHSIDHETRFLSFANANSCLDFHTSQDWREHHEILEEKVEAAWSLLGYKNPARVHIITGENTPLRERPGYEHH